MNTWEWRLPQAEVDWEWTYSTPNQNNRARNARSEAERGSFLKLLHEPTGIVVEGTVKPGRYTQRQMIDKRREVYEECFDQLEEIVRERLGK